MTLTRLASLFDMLRSAVSIIFMCELCKEAFIIHPGYGPISLQGAVNELFVKNFREPCTGELLRIPVPRRSCIRARGRDEAKVSQSQALFLMIGYPTCRLYLATY